jgi:hypothetical protein
MSIVRALALVCSCVWASGASAQTYPDRPITMMVAFPPGGADDAIARIIHEPMEKALGREVARCAVKRAAIRCHERHSECAYATIASPAVLGIAFAAFASAPEAN